MGQNLNHKKRSAATLRIHKEGHEEDRREAEEDRKRAQAEAERKKKREEFNSMFEEANAISYERKAPVVEAVNEDDG